MKILREADVNSLELSEIKSLDDFNEWLLRAVKNDNRIRKIVNNVYNSVNSVNLTSDDKKFIEEIVLKNFREKDTIFENIAQEITLEDVKNIKNYNKKPVRLADRSGTIRNELSSGLIKKSLGTGVQDTGVGKGEVLLALLGGTKQLKGDIKLNGKYYEVKYVEQAAEYNQSDREFNESVKKLFNILDKNNLIDNKENTKRLRAHYFKNITRGQIYEIAKNCGLERFVPNGDNNALVGEEVFYALAEEAAYRACDGDKAKFLILLNSNLDYVIINYNEINNNEFGIRATFEPGHGNQYVFKLVKYSTKKT